MGVDWQLDSLDPRIQSRTDAAGVEAEVMADKTSQAIIDDIRLRYANGETRKEIVAATGLAMITIVRHTSNIRTKPKMTLLTTDQIQTLLTGWR